MRAAILLCPLFIAACASSPKDLKSMPIAEVCYLGMVEPEKQQQVADEVRRRNEDCNRHSAEINKIRDMEMRAGQSVGEARPSGGTSGGGMGRGY